MIAAVANGRLMNVDKRTSEATGSEFYTGQIQDEIREPDKNDKKKSVFVKRYTNFVAWGKTGESLAALAKGTAVNLIGDIGLETYASTKENKEVTVQKIAVGSWSQAAQTFINNNTETASEETTEAPVKKSPFTK